MGDRVSFHTLEGRGRSRRDQGLAAPPVAAAATPRITTVSARPGIAPAPELTPPAVAGVPEVQTRVRAFVPNRAATDSGNPSYDGVRKPTRAQPVTGKGMDPQAAPPIAVPPVRVIRLDDRRGILVRMFGKSPAPPEPGAPCQRWLA